MVRSALFAVAVAAAAMVCGCEKKTATGLAGQKLEISKPMDESITRGETGEVDINIDRTDFSGPVTVAVSNLPSGVVVTNSSLTIPSDDEKITLTLRADPTAQIVKDQVATVRVTSPTGVTVSETFKVTVNSDK